MMIWDFQSLNSIIISEESEDFASLIGSNKEPDNILVGQYEDFEISWTEDARYSVMIHVFL